MPSFDKKRSRPDSLAGVGIAGPPKARALNRGISRSTLCAALRPYVQFGIKLRMGLNGDSRTSESFDYCTGPAARGSFNSPRWALHVQEAVAKESQDECPLAMAN